MRQKLKNILGEERGFLALETKEHLGVTQKRMREKLNMGERSYSDVKAGRYHCGVLTAILLSDEQDTLRYRREVQPA